ncbi:uncharacterized protein LOC129581753 [Paramacrobiotus metropolitanus]|uniref:uncharacterized protein LOC129581753 n=1 Tax=Paramacrobiotus metropolitanus TaxID=2943436 RepID=UPI0024458871|nr:uncharacterized protein LOC129581753 [Paramacrobiotus metropolitanus]
MAIISKIYIVLRMILTVLLFGESSVKRLYVSCEESERAVCPLPTPCYRWVNLNGGSCDLGTEIQPDNTATGIDACPSWFRGFRYYPYQFDLLENVLQSSDGKILDVIALSRCTRRPFGAAPERQDAVAVLRGPNIGPAACTVWRVTFWYRLSDYPVFDSANPQNQFYLKVFVENNGETFPSELIWGREEDYDEFRPNVWYSGEGVFHRDQSEPFALYWFAYHNDNCDVDLKEIAVDSMRIQYATSATPASGICPTTTVAPPQTTPPSTPTPVIPDTTPTTTPSTTTTESPTTTRESPTPTEIVDSTTTPDTTTVSPEPDPDTPSIDTTESTPTPSTATPSTVTDAPVSETTPSTATAILDANTTAPAMTTATVSIEPGTEMNTTSITATASIETNTTSTPTESTNSTVPITSLETAPPGNITATTPSIATPITTTTNGTSPSSQQPHR